MSFTDLPRTLIRAARLTMRPQQKRPGSVSEWAALFRQKLRHPSNLPGRVSQHLSAGNWNEIDRLVKDVDYYYFDGLHPVHLHDLDDLERRILIECTPLLAQTGGSIAQLSRSVRYIIEAGIPGDFVECGVYKGASIVTIIRTLQALGVTDRKIWLYDTFEGMPEPEEIDVHYAQTPTEDGGIKSWELHKKPDTGGSDWCFCPIDEVKRTVYRTGYPQDNLNFVKGLVENTIPGTIPSDIALLRLDTDFYSSTKHEFTHLYPILRKGGVLIIDDYGAYQGSRIATDEYFKENKLHVLLSRIDENVRLLVKP
ncbi:MAG: TylF/MycF/NovP-related O-methyltransferase [Pseudolabrys sp.]